MIAIKPNSHATETNFNPAGVTIRRLDAADSAEVMRLAQRDTAPVPDGALLGAEAEGRLLAAISTATGAVIADPFAPTAEIVEVLRLRATQLEGRPRRWGLVARLLAGTRGATRSAPSPPGAGDRLLAPSERPAR